MLAIVEVKRQHSIGSCSGFGGPNCYVAVQIVPDGVKPLLQLNKRVANHRGIKIRYFGEGYSDHTGPRSMLRKAKKEAESFAKEINSGDLHGI